MKFGNKGIPGRRRTEITSGGSEILTYSDVRPPVGAPSKEAERNRRNRESVYEEYFGSYEFVSHEIGMQVPHVDVYAYSPGHRGRDFYTLVTGGMSDLPMRVPRGVSANRAELVMYVEEPKEEYLALLRFLAHFPHNHHTWLGFDHTFPNGQPAQPLFDDAALDTLLMIRSILEPDATLSQSLRIDKDPVCLLWVVPITTAECELKLRAGSEALLDLFDQVEHPIVLDEKRPSYV